jgi:hypothetical protein
MQAIIDRFEGLYAICEKSDRKMIKIERSRLPAEVREGDVLQIEGDSIRLDIEATRQKRKAAEERFNRLRQP